MTRATEAARIFIESTDEVSNILTEVRLDQAVDYYVSYIRESVQSIIGVNSSLDLFQIEWPSSDESHAYAMYAAWHEYVRQNEGLTEEYYEARPYSPFYHSEATFNELIQRGERQASDKDIWSISFMHPSGTHFYTAKYMPGEDGYGFGYRISVNGNLSELDAINKSIAEGKRYNRDHREP